MAGASTAARAQGGAVAEEEEEEKEKEPDEKDVEDVGGEMTEANVDDGGDGDGDGDGDADAPTRGLFGRLAGVAKKWDDVVRAYERDGLHLPETALAMARGVDLEIPHHDAKAARASKQLADLDRRESELKRGVGVAREAYKSACDALGVSAAAAAAGRGGDGGNGGKAFAEELKRIAGGLDDAFAECAALARKSDVGEAMTRYAEWCAWAHGDARGAETFTPTLLELRAYEDGATIEPPATKTTTTAAAVDDDAAPPPPTIVEPPSGGIDWDIGDASAGGPEVVAPPAGGIDWDLGDLAADGGGDDAADGAAMIVEPPAGGIDWDLDLGVEVEVEPTGEAPTVVDAPEGGIDWGIAVEDVAPAEEDDDAAADGGFSLDAAMASVATIDVSSTATAIAARVPFHARLRDQDFRAALVNELSELAAFFSQRVADSRSPETTSLLASAPASIQRSSAPDVLADLRAAVLAPVATLRAARTRKLLLIASSERYARRLASELESKARAEGKARSTKIPSPVPVRPRSRGARRSLTEEFRRPGWSSLRPPLGFMQSRHTSTPFNSASDAF